MLKKDYFIDIHCHSTMRIFHNKSDNGNTNYWDENKNDYINNFFGRTIVKLSKQIAKVSQSNYYHCAHGNVRVVFDSLYPVERGFVKFRKSAKNIFGRKNSEAFVVNTSGISRKQYSKYMASQDYFSELYEQYDFLIKNQGPSPCGKYNYKVVANFTELNEWLDKDPGNMATVVTIEGAHVFGCGTIDTENMDVNDLENQVLKNIEAIKKWKYPPFFITFAHHFWNQLCGHASSLSSATKITCDQKQGIDIGFTELGKKVLNALLSNKNGKRILIDTRHMSAISRHEYYQFIEDYNTRNPDDIIPTISSHTAVNGYDNFLDSTKLKDNKSKIKTSKFYAWSINMCREEIKSIHRARGVIGIILDKGRYCGKSTLKKINSITDPKQKKEAFLKIILDNLFFYIESIGEKSAWDIITLGTDFDGVITHFDCYENMSKLPELKQDLIAYLKKTEYNKKLWYDLTPEEMFDKIFHSNAYCFLKNNFN